MLIWLLVDQFPVRPAVWRVYTRTVKSGKGGSGENAAAEVAGKDE